MLKNKNSHPSKNKLKRKINPQIFKLNNKISKLNQKKKKFK